MRRARGERGQILVVVVLALVALLGIAAFAIDVGYAYYAKRQLQSATDAAALAGAQDLPNAGTAITTAQGYAAANTPGNLSFTDFTYETKCTATAVIAGGCNAAVNPNALIVSGTASTDTWFAKIFGIDHFNISAHANACSPCSSTPIDIVVAIDRTGSMCLNPGGGHDCSDLNNAKDGVETMLGMFNPPSAEIGMIAFPPLPAGTKDMCIKPQGTSNNYTAYDDPNAVYVNDQISDDYKTATSPIVEHMVEGDGTCIQADGYTSYSQALREAQEELVAHGRPTAPDYIVFLTDGEANIGNVYGPKTAYPQDGIDDAQPCQAAINSAADIKKAGTTIYSIGYALGTKECTAGGFRKPDPDKPGAWLPCTLPDPDCQHHASESVESPAMTSLEALKQIASAGNFYNQPKPGDLSAIFALIANDIAQGSSRLVDDGF